MLKKSILVVLIGILLLGVSGCRESEKASYNLSKEADSFNVVRQLTVINSRSDVIQFQMTGKMSIEFDAEDNQLEVMVEDADGKYYKEIVGLNEWSMYVLEDKSGADVSNYKYTLIYNENMLVPVEVKTVD
jgi:hypothetical protein